MVIGGSYLCPLPTPPRRAKFSVQVREFVDLVITRLSDLKSQEETRRRKEIGTTCDRSPGVGIPGAMTHIEDDGDPAMREVR